MLGVTADAASPQLSSVAAALSELLSDELTAGEKLRRVPQDTVTRMRMELALPTDAPLGASAMTAAHRYSGADLVVLQRRLELGLDIVLAALDFVDHGLLIAAGDRRLQVEPATMRGAGRRAVGLRIATERADMRLQLGCDLAVLFRHFPEELLVGGVLAVLGCVGIALHAVERGGDKRVGDGDVV